MKDGNIISDLAPMLYAFTTATLLSLPFTGLQLIDSSGVVSDPSKGASTRNQVSRVECSGVPIMSKPDASCYANEMKGSNVINYAGSQTNPESMSVIERSGSSR